MDPILVVDDEPDLLTVYERLFTRAGFRVVTAGSYAEAMQRFDAGPIALVVTDLRLPDGSGVDIVQRGRAFPVPVPSILVTGSGPDAAATTATAVGATRSFAKPFRIADLVAAVRELMAVSGRDDATAGVA